jgi:hypothetical protein
MYVAQLSASAHSLCGSDLHATCKMSSPLEICFSSWQLCFVVECRELYAATKSLPHGKAYESHDSHTLPHYQFKGL